MSLKLIRRLHRAETGQAVAMFVGLLVPIIGFTAIAVDLGFFFHTRSLAQNAADASVLAGALELEGCGDGSPAPEVVAEDYAGRNFDNVRTFSTPADDTIDPVEVRPGAFEIEGTQFDTVYTRVEREQSFLFAQLFGFLKSPIPAHAEAACLPANEVGICPIYIRAPDPDDTDPSDGVMFGLNLEEVYQLKLGSQGDSSGGNRGYLSIYGNGGKDIRDAIEAGCVGDDPDYTVSEGDVVTDPKPGNMASVWNSINELYEYEGTNTCIDAGVTVPCGDQDYCHLTFDDTDFNGQPYNFSVSPGESPSELEDKIQACDTDPDPMDHVLGRLWPIAVSDTPLCNGRNCDIHISHIAWMYIACWGTRHDTSCSTENSPGQASLYGMFFSAERVTAVLPNLEGVSNNPLAPRRPLLVR
jgi:hypothetical protein